MGSSLPLHREPPGCGLRHGQPGARLSRRFAAGLALLPRPGFAHGSRRSTRPRPQLPPAQDPHRGHQRRLPRDGSGRRGEAAAAGRGHGQVRGCAEGLRVPSQGSWMGSPWPKPSVQGEDLGKGMHRSRAECKERAAGPLLPPPLPSPSRLSRCHPSPQVLPGHGTEASSGLGAGPGAHPGAESTAPPALPCGGGWQ